MASADVLRLLLVSGAASLRPVFLLDFDCVFRDSRKKEKILFCSFLDFGFSRMIPVPACLGVIMTARSEFD